MQFRALQAKGKMNDDKVVNTYERLLLDLPLQR